jgi:Uma2 family endonuclease
MVVMSTTTEEATEKQVEPPGSLWPGIHPGKSFTISDLDSDAFPDDGRRYELVDGVLIVTSFPTMRHQVAAGGLSRLLRDARRQGLVVVPGPIDVEEEPGTDLGPDVSVVRAGDHRKPATEVRPLLIAEVLSPSTRRYDRTLKMDKYRELGIANYWLVDPDEPSIVGYELREGAYIEVGQASGDEAFDTEQPFPVRIVPAELLADLDG